MDPVDVTHFDTPAAFREWLTRHHERDEPLWVGFWKKATRRPSISWEESVDEALCFGWIDGLRKSIDDHSYTIRFTQRRPGSNWSRRNIDRFEVLQGQGRIQPAGHEAYARRTEEKSGVYSFEQKTPTDLAPDFVERFRANERAWLDWEGRPPGYRRQATHWVMSAKRPETRERRFSAVVEDCEAGRKIKPLRR